MRNPLNPFDSGYSRETNSIIDFRITQYAGFLIGVFESSFLWRFLFYSLFFTDAEKSYYNRISLSIEKKINDQ